MQDELLVGLTLIAVLAGVGQIVAVRLRIPAILVLLVLGLLAGPATGVLDPDELLGDLLFPFVSLSVAVILFEGGLLLQLRELTRDTRVVIRRLLLVGLTVTWVGGAVAAVRVLDLQPAVAAVLGALLTVSGPTVVLPLIRFIRPTPDVAAVLKWEGIFIDALGAGLAVIVFEAVLAGDASPGVIQAAVQVALTLLVGGVVGGIAAWAVVLLLERWDVEAALSPIIPLLAVLAAFTVSDLLRSESGLFAAIVMGVTLANQQRVSVERIAEFKETLGVLLTSVLFIVLPARLTVAELTTIGLPVAFFVAVLVLVVRPTVVAVAAVGSQLTWRERMLLGWMAPRGIVAAATASTFGFRLANVGIPGAERLAPITFVVILTTVAIYALTGAPLARALGVTEHSTPTTRHH